MTETPTPLPQPITEWGIIWKVQKGNAITENGNDMTRDENDIPIYPSENEFGFNDFMDPNGSPDDEGKLSWFHTTYKWNSVELKYAALNEDGIRPLKDFQISAQVYGLRENMNKPDNNTFEDPEGEGEEEVSDEPYEFAGLVDFRVKSMTIESVDPNSSGTWVYPDDYPDTPDVNHPIQYGGVVTFTDTYPAEVKAGESFKCGIDDGPEDDGIIPWMSTSGYPQEDTSEYIYIEVFDQAKFAFTPRNSFDSLPQSATNVFRSTPYYPDVKDPNGLAAPIYPMNTLTAFVPDPRETVTVTYKVSIEVEVKVGKQYKVVEIQNKDITIKQTCIQDTSDYIDQMEEIGRFCQFQNPENYTQEELSPNYNYDYPYTLVSGYDGLEVGVIPETRGDDKDNEPLQRGDVWYDPGTDTRLTWNDADVPETLDVVEGGKAYKDNDNAMCIWMVPLDEEGNQVRCFKIEDVNEIPSNLFAKIKTENGQIVSAEVSDSGSPTAWSDGDVVRVVGGNNQAMLRVNIKDPAGWSTKFIDKY